MKNKMLSRLIAFWSFLLIVLVSVCFIRQLSAQTNNIKFRRITNNEGLSSNHVECIFQDNNGFIWIGTDAGLNKFDGYSFKTYKHHRNDSTSINSNKTMVIFQDSKGILWVGTDKGLCRYNLDEDNFSPCSVLKNTPLSASKINSLAEDKYNKLWITISNNYAFRIDFESKKITEYMPVDTIPGSISHKDIRQIFRDSHDNLWFATMGGLDLFNFEEETFTHFRYNPDDSTSISANQIEYIDEDTENNLIIGTGNNGICRLDIKSLDKPKFTRINTQTNTIKLQSNVIQRILADKRGGIWAGIQNVGVSYINKTYSGIITYKNNPSDRYSLSQESIYALFQDKTNDIWVGTFAGGLNIIHYTKQGFQHYKNIQGNPNSLSYNIVTKFCEDSEGNFWIGTDGGGLNKFDIKTGLFKCYNTKNSNLPKDAVLTIIEDSDGDLLIGTWAGGLSIFNKEKETFTTYTEKNSTLSNNNIFKIIQDRKDRIWIVTNGGGLCRFDKANKTFVNYMENNSIESDYNLSIIIEDCLGNLIFGGYQGIYVLNIDKNECDTFTHIPDSSNSLSNTVICALFEDSDSTLWIGTEDGLNHLVRKTNTFTHYFEEDGLPGSAIYGILKDNKNNLWLSTDNGISMFNLSENTFKNYTKSDGLQGNQFNRFSCYKSKSGLLFFGGMNGFNVFDPDELIDNPNIPPIIITEFFIANKPVIPGSEDAPIEHHISKTKEIVLSYDQSSFSFSFTALNYVSSQKNRYAYKLENFNDEWVYVGNHKTATYTNIDPGNYIFRVKGSNNDGLWNDKGVSVQVTILPPYWETWWFKILALLFVISIAVSVYLYRINALKRQKRILEDKVNERTMELKEANNTLNERQEEILQQNEEIMQQNELLAKQKNKIEEAYKIVEFQNNKISGSINYAKTIQQAILPFKETMNQYFKHFVIYRPKDVVSGDFYWFAVENKNTQNEMIFIAVVDCTGHGVPGAFMSMIGNSLLNEIVRVKKVHQPDEILNELNKSIRLQLKQEQTNNNDGMVLCLVRIDKETLKTDNKSVNIQYSGAKCPLYYCSSGNLHVVKPSISAIGGRQFIKSESFTCKKIILQKNDMIYLASDGYKDQNNKQRKRFGSPKLKHILTSVYKSTLNEQKNALEKALNEYMQNEEQRDDITLMGIKV